MTDLPITTYFVLSKHSAPAALALPVETKRVLSFAFDARQTPLRTQGRGVASQGAAAKSCTLVFSGRHRDLEEAASLAGLYKTATLLSFRDLTKPPFQLYRLENVTVASVVTLPPQAGNPDGAITTTAHMDFGSIKTEYGGPATTP